MRVFEIDDQTESAVGGAAQYIVALSHDVLRLDFLTLELRLFERCLETLVG